MVSLLHSLLETFSRLTQDYSAVGTVVVLRSDFDHDMINNIHSVSNPIWSLVYDIVKLSIIHLRLSSGL